MDTATVVASHSESPLEPPRAVRGGTRSFVASFFLAFAIAMLPFVTLTLRAALIGETDLLDTDQRLAQETVHGPLAESFAEYKLRRALVERPAVLLFGTSRTLRWRGSFFDLCSNGPRCFYNASGAMDTVQTADVFLHRLLQTYTPRVLLLDIAPFNFDPNFVLNDHRAPDLEPSPLARLHQAMIDEQELLLTSLTDADLRNALLGRIPPTPSGYRGVRAMLRGEGFLPDGAYSEGTALTAYGADNAVQRVHQQGERFEWFSHADPRALAELEDMLTLAQSRGVAVLAFETPFSDSVVDAVASEPRLGAGWTDTDTRVKAIMDAHRIPFVQFKNISAISCSEDETLDGFHPGEVCSARLLGHLLDDATFRQTLAPYVTADVLARLIDRRYSSLLLEKP